MSHRTFFHKRAIRHSLPIKQDHIEYNESGPIAPISNNNNNKPAKSDLKASSRGKATATAATIATNRINRLVLKAIDDTNMVIFRLKQRLKLIMGLCGSIAVVIMILGIWEYEIYYDNINKPHFSSTRLTFIFRLITSILTFILILLLIIQSYISYIIDLKNDSSLSIPSSTTTTSSATSSTTSLATSSITFSVTTSFSSILSSLSPYYKSIHFKHLIIELIINSIHLPPFFNDKVFHIKQLDAEFEYSLDGIIVNITMLKVYLVLKFLIICSKWSNQISNDCCRVDGLSTNSQFIIKALFKERPYTTLLITGSVSTIILGFMIRNFERPYYYSWTSSADGFQDYSYLWNGIWLIAITMLTIGYGDFFPKTHMGRFIAVMASLWGVFLVSMMVTTLTISTTFDIKEKKSFWVLHRIDTMGKLKIKASELITLMFRLNLVYSRYKAKKISWDEYLNMRCELRNKLQMKIMNYRVIKSSLSEFEIQPEELLGQLINKIDKDYYDIKGILREMVELEHKMNKIECMQDELLNEIDEAIEYTRSSMRNIGKIGELDGK